jgi:two-component system chemotaxis response regulator CheY
MHSILAVDDSASMRQMVAFTLKSAGYSVVEAVDGQDAWEKTGKNDFDLVLTDQNMPRMDAESSTARIECMGVSGFPGTFSVQRRDS